MRPNHTPPTHANGGQPPTLEDLPLSTFHRLLTVRSGGGSFVDGYVLSIIGVGMVRLSAALQLSSLWQGLIAASALIGIFCGGLIGGPLTDHFGRKRIFFVGPTLFIVFSLAQLWVNGPIFLFTCRFFIGIGVGIEYPVATALLVEFLPRRHRGPRLATLTIMWFAGAATAYIVGNMILGAGGAQGWRLALASSALIGLALLLVRIGTPESPRWLLSKGRTQDANAVIRQVYGNTYSTADLPELPQTRKVSLLDLLRSGYGTRLVFVILFWTCSVIPVFAVYAFAPKVLLALNLHGKWAAYGSIAITLMFVIGCVAATAFINAMGRRPMLIQSFLWSSLALLVLGVEANGPSLVILLAFGAYAFFIGGAQVLQLVYPNELFPTEIRAVAVGCGTSLSRVGAAIGTYLVPLSLDTLGIAYTMYAAAAVSAVGLASAIILAPETGSLNLAEAASLDT
ncbi:MAG: MFS transporter [Acetobacter sp.]|uniref:MFS transporter n=1 Tax=Acetobacter sp. TaxID=440 RepID=UPI0039EA669B